MPPEEWEREELFPDALGLSQEVMAKLRAAQLLDDRNAAGAGAADGSDSGGPVQSSGWQAMDTTTEVAPNRFNIGTEDRELLSRDPNRVFGRDVGTATWRSTTGNMSGVKITNLAPGYERYGVQRGDIILAINGEPVSSKGEAIKIGKQLYKRGVRSFEIEFLSNGRRVSRTYVAPDE